MKTGQQNSRYDMNFNILDRTRYEQRIRGGYNELDRMCKIHDQFYNENKDRKKRNISDIALAHRADEIANNLNYDEAQRKDAKFISGIMKAKAYLGFGLNDIKYQKARNGVLEQGTSRWIAQTAHLEFLIQWFSSRSIGCYIQTTPTKKPIYQNFLISQQYIKNPLNY